MKTNLFTWKLKGSAGSLEDLIKLIKVKMYFTPQLIPISENCYAVYGEKGLIKEAQVRKSKNRYRLEFLIRS